jgi:two-component system, cell cycle sensor histidine kinase and response regulator CckA
MMHPSDPKSPDDPRDDSLPDESSGALFSEPPGALLRFASIIESSEDAIVSKDLNGTVLTWNRGAAAIYGYTAEEMIGQPIHMLVPPERRDEEEAILTRIRAGQRVQHYETIRVRKGGTRLNVSLTVSPIREGGRVIGASHVARDISERKRLESANAQLAAIVESSDDAIISKDLQGVIQTWNASAARVYGYPAEEVIGRNMTFLLPPGRENEEEQILDKIRRGERVEHYETVRLRKGGESIHVALTISPIRDRDGALVGASHVARDITERRAFEQQMRQAQRLESLGVLAGGIAHDFNNLLTGIIGNASLAAETLTGAHAARRYLDELTLSAERAADLTRQLLAYSGRGQFVVGPVSVSDVVAEISTLVKASTPKTVDVRLHLDRRIPPIEADRSQIQQLLMNLVINAAEAIGEGRPGRVTVKTGADWLEGDFLRAAFPGAQIEAGNYVFIEVEDDGCGMDEQTRARIFDPFFTTKFTGRGLGLAAATGIVKAHNGAIRVVTAAGKGTAFKVIFPVRREEVVEEREPAKAESKAAVTGVVLVVDDEEIVRNVAKAALQIQGYRVILACDGREAVEVFREMSDSISLVILDLTMPVMGGEEALRRMRDIRPDVTVMLSSGYTQTDAMRRFSDEGLAGFIQKPYTSARLRETVDAVVQKAPRSTSAD